MSWSTGTWARNDGANASLAWAAVRFAPPPLIRSSTHCSRVPAGVAGMVIGPVGPAEGAAEAIPDGEAAGAGEATGVVPEAAAEGAAEDVPEAVGLASGAEPQPARMIPATATVSRDRAWPPRCPARRSHASWMTPKLMPASREKLFLRHDDVCPSAGADALRHGCTILRVDPAGGAARTARLRRSTKAVPFRP